MAIGVGIIVLSAYLTSRISKDRKDGFATCPTAGCGDYGNELKRQLGLLGNLCVGSLISHSLTVVFFFTKGYIFDYGSKSGFGTIFMVFLIMSGLLLTSVSLGAVSFNTLSFLKEHAQAGTWVYDKSVNAIESIVAANFVLSVSMVLLAAAVNNYSSPNNMGAGSRQQQHQCEECGHIAEVMVAFSPPRPVMYYQQQGVQGMQGGRQQYP